MKRCLLFFKVLKEKKINLYGGRVYWDISKFKILLIIPSFAKLAYWRWDFSTILIRNVGNNKLSSCTGRQGRAESSLLCQLGPERGKVELSPLEKLAFAVMMLATKLRPYFESHTIDVRTNFPLWEVLHKPELSGQLSTWAIMLSAYDIMYIPRSAMFRN